MNTFFSNLSKNAFKNVSFKVIDIGIKIPERITSRHFIALGMTMGTAIISVLGQVSKAQVEKETAELTYGKRKRIEKVPLPNTDDANDDPIITSKDSNESAEETEKVTVEEFKESKSEDSESDDDDDKKTKTDKGSPKLKDKK